MHVIAGVAWAMLPRLGRPADVPSKRRRLVTRRRRAGVPGVGGSIPALREGGCGAGPPIHTWMYTAAVQQPQYMWMGRHSTTHSGAPPWRHSYRDRSLGV